MSSYEEATSAIRRSYEEAYGPQFAPGAYQFDVNYQQETGEYPRESPLYGTTPRSADPRRQAIINLAERGATEGEREAARAALLRIDQEQQDEDDYLDALHHGAA